MSLARLQIKALEKQIGEVKAVSKVFQRSEKNILLSRKTYLLPQVANEISKLFSSVWTKKTFFFLLSSKLCLPFWGANETCCGCARQQKWMKNFWQTIFSCSLQTMFAFFWRFWGKTLQNNPTQQRKCVAKKNASPRHVCSEQNSIHFSEVQTYFNFESRRMSGVQEIQAATYLPTTLRELPIFKENFLNLIEAHTLLLFSSLCKKVLFRNPVATRIFAHQLLNVSETPQENWIWTNDK